MIMDWADEIAERVNREQVATVGDREALIAAALRKAKADGMREAIYLYRSGGYSKVEARANAIEKGTA